MEQQPVHISQALESEVLQKLGRVEKFVANQNLILQKMTEKLEVIESDNMKNTMRYNSFREDYKRLIEEQVDMRTASHKDEFISLDELRPVKIAIKEIEVRLRSKLDVSTFTDEAERRDREAEESKEHSRLERERAKAEVDSQVQHLKKADSEAQSNIKELREYLVSIIVSNQEEVLRKLQAHDSKLIELGQTDGSLAARVAELSSVIQTNRETWEQQAKQKQEQDSRRFRDADKKITELDKALRKELYERTEKLSISLEALDVRQSTIREAAVRGLDTTRSQIAQMIEEVQTKLREHQDRTDMINGCVDGLRGQFDEERAKVASQLGTLQTSISLLSAQLEAQQLAGEESPVSRHSAAKKNDSQITKRQPTPKNQDGDDTIGEASSPTNRNRPKTRLEDNRTSDIEAKSTIQADQLESGTVPLLHTHVNQSPPNFGRPYHSSSNAGDYTQSAGVFALKSKLTELESNFGILREMIDSKVNFSEIVKLQESKCSKISLKELMSKLQTFKAIIEKQLPNAEALRQLAFDETMAGSTLTRLSMIRTRQHKEGDSRNGSKQKDKEREQERKSIYSRLPNMLSHSRKRYLTLLDRSESHTVQEVRPLNLP